MTQDATEQAAGGHVETELAPAKRQQRLRSRPRALAVTGAAVGVVVAALVASRIFGSAESSDAATTPTATAKVTRRDLVQRSTVSGTLGYDDARRVVNYRRGTITSLPEEGQILQPGAVLYRVNEEPIVLFSGSQPAWRPLAVGVTNGRDVLQLEQNLRALGYDDDREMAVDRRFDASTAAAVERWREGVGLAETGRVELGDVVFLPGARRVGTVAASGGDPARPGAPVMETSSTKRLVTARINSSDQGDLAVGDTVVVDLLNGATTTGTITELGKVASVPEGEMAGQQASGATTSTMTFQVRPDRPTLLSRLDRAPVEVAITSKRAENALSVPVTALLALRGGRYGVEVARGETSRVVTVTPGLYSDDGYVVIKSGRVRPGDVVVVPA